MVAESVVCEVDVPLARTEGYPYIFQQTVECDIQNANELAYQVELGDSVMVLCFVVEISSMLRRAALR